MSVEVGTPTYMIKYLISDVGISAGVASLIAAVYWFAMFIGRSIGGSIGGKVSSRAMVFNRSYSSNHIIGVRYVGTKHIDSTSSRC